MVNWDFYNPLDNQKNAFSLNVARLRRLQLFSSYLSQLMFLETTHKVLSVCLFEHVHRLDRIW